MKDALALEKDVYQSLLDLHNVSQNANDPQVQNLVVCNHTHSLWCLFLATHEYENRVLAGTCTVAEIFLGLMQRQM